MSFLKRLGGLLAGAFDGAFIAMVYATITETHGTDIAIISAISGGIIGLIFPTLAFIVCIPIAIYLIKYSREHDPRNNPQNRINM